MSFKSATPRVRSYRLRYRPVPPPEPLHSLIATLQGKDNPQNESPLFSAIPPELRNAILRMMLTTYDDKSAPYPENNHYNRPGYRFRHRIDTAVLSTCRRIYREAHILPVSVNEHVFWASSGRGPPGLKFCDNPTAQFSRLTVEQRDAIQHVHLFTQMSWLEGALPTACNSNVFRMRHLKITIRHGDWWYWESNHPLRIKNIWTEHLKAITSLESLQVELETMERDKSQLEAIVKLMQTWRINIANNRILTTEGKPANFSRYTGPSNYDGLQYDHQANKWMWHHPAQQGDTTVPAPPLFYVGYTLHWVAKAM